MPNLFSLKVIQTYEKSIYARYFIEHLFELKKSLEFVGKFS